MKSFKDFIKNKIETDKDGTPILNTIFGAHSIKESTEKEVKNTHDALIKHYNKFDDADKDAIYDYTNESYLVNSHMHRKVIGKLRKGEKEHPLVKPMKQMINRHKTPQDMVVYSGIGKSPEHVIKHQKGETTGAVVKTSNFTSTSLSKNAATDYARAVVKSKYNSKYKNSLHGRPGHILKIHVPKGHPGAYVDHHSVHRGEKEFILPHGTKMHIHPEPEYDKKTHNMIWQAHVLPHEDTK